MADIYLRSSDGSDGNTGLGLWTNAKATFIAALTAAGAGGTVFMSSDHNETGGTKINIGGTINSLIRVLSVDDTQPEGSEVLKAGGLYAVGRNIFRAYLYIDGCTLSGSGNLEVSGTPGTTIFKDCTLKATDSTSDFIFAGDGDNRIVLINTILDFAHVNNTIKIGAGVSMLWKGGSITGIVPNILITPTSGNVNIRDVDLSILDTNLLIPTTEQGWNITLERCKLHASLTVLSTPFIGTGIVPVKLHSCDSANTTIAIHEESYEGVVIDETTIVKAQGMSDGTTPQSLKMTTNANAIEFLQPLVSPPITGRIKTLGEKVVTIEFIHDSLTNLKNDDIWMDLEQSTGADAQGVITSTKLSSILGTSADVTASTATWTTTGLTNPNKQKLQVTFTPLKIGQITARVYKANPSTTAYLDFKLTVADT